jgi:hypothetical protein
MLLASPTSAVSVMNPGQGDGASRRRCWLAARRLHDMSPNPSLVRNNADPIPL